MQPADREDMQGAAVAEGVLDLVIGFGGHAQGHRADHGGGLGVILEVFCQLGADPLPAGLGGLQKAAVNRARTSCGALHAFCIEACHEPVAQREVLGVEGTGIRGGARQVDVSLQLELAHGGKHAARRQAHEHGCALVKLHSQAGDADAGCLTDRLAAAVVGLVEVRQQRAAHRRRQRRVGLFQDPPQGVVKCLAHARLVNEGEDQGACREEQPRASGDQR